MPTTTTQDRSLAIAIRSWLGDNLWGTPWFKLSTRTDHNLIEAMFISGLSRLYPHAGQAEVQVVLDVLRQEHRMRNILGDVEMERRRRATA